MNHYLLGAIVCSLAVVGLADFKGIRQAWQQYRTLRRGR